jgi:branched-chain amino acid aminotransferase
MVQAAPTLAYVNGNLVPIDSAKISILDHGLLYGDGLFEGLSVDDGRIYRLDEHIDRLFRSAKYLRITSPLPRADMADAVANVAAVNGLRDGYMRPILTRGTGPMGLGATRDIVVPNFLIIPQVRARMTDEARLETGLRACTLNIRRIPAQCLDPRVKTTNYLNQILGKFETWDAGADVGVMLTPSGEVSECCGENIFIVTNGVLRTPPGHLVLEGITRRSIIDIHRSAGGEVREESLFPFDLYTADEIFVTATLIEVASVTTIDGRGVGDGPAGPVTRRLFAALREDMAVNGRVVDYERPAHDDRGFAS